MVTTGHKRPTGEASAGRERPNRTRAASLDCRTRFGTEVKFDEDNLKPHVSYLDEQNVQHDIWFQDG